MSSYSALSQVTAALLKCLGACSRLWSHVQACERFSCLCASSQGRGSCTAFALTTEHAVLQIADQARIIVAQEQKYAKDVNNLSVQLMQCSAAAGIQSFSPISVEEDTDDE